MTFLAKLGKILLTVASTAVGVGPIVQPLFGAKGGKIAGEIGTVTNDLTAIASVIAQVEVVAQSTTGMTSGQKLQAAVALVKPILLTSQMISGKKIADPALLDKAATELAQGVCDALNAIHPDAVSTEVSHA